MTRLSVNINKIATLRNARGGNTPDVLKAALDCERYGAQGITVHPRPDARHIRYDDVRQIAKHINVELNIEGYPSPEFIALVRDVHPAQVTLVPDTSDVLTSNAGWDVVANEVFLSEVVSMLHTDGIRCSVFVEADTTMVCAAASIGADRVELYTEPYAARYKVNREAAVEQYVVATRAAAKHNLQVNAGHDLSLINLHYFIMSIPYISEVSIGHALICDALYYGLENTIQMYLRELSQ
jgi:pyridoxine 5-phosphate synthase